MENILNCHSVGLHSFPVSFENGLYKRIFYADTNHNLWKVDPLEIAIHPHHVDIKITVLDGVLLNNIYRVSTRGEIFKSFLWDSHILNGKGGFKRIGEERLQQVSCDIYSAGKSAIMKSCELHTVFVRKGAKAVWMIEEEMASCGYNPINYSNWNLENWTPEGLYIPTTNEVRERYISEYRSKVNATPPIK